MASFKDKFLRDLEDLSDEEEVNKEELKSEAEGSESDEDMEFAEY